jgi:hypothetical protein
MSHAFRPSYCLDTCEEARTYLANFLSDPAEILYPGNLRDAFNKILKSELISKFEVSSESLECSNAAMRRVGASVVLLVVFALMFGV